MKKGGNLIKINVVNRVEYPDSDGNHEETGIPPDCTELL
jgi:hypothetical protein